MNVVGIDLSLTATGVALTIGEYLTVKVKTTGMRRLSELRNELLPFCHPADLVVIEGYSMGTARQSSHAHALGELGGVIRLKLWEEGIAYVDVAPASLKKYATGKGNAKKDEVFAAAIRRLGYEGNDHNEADALWLRAMALDHYGEAVCNLPAKHLEALDVVLWPTLTAAVDR